MMVVCSGRHFVCVPLYSSISRFIVCGVISPGMAGTGILLEGKGSASSTPGR